MEQKQTTYPHRIRAILSAAAAARVRGTPEDAAKAYDRTIKHAKDNERDCGFSPQPQ